MSHFLPNLSLLETASADPQRRPCPPPRTIAATRESLRERRNEVKILTARERLTCNELNEILILLCVNVPARQIHIASALTLR